MFALIVSYHARQEQYVFTAAEAAQAEMTAIESKIGKKWYGKNGDEENPTYRFEHSCGQAAVCLEKIESVSVTELSKDETVSGVLFDRSMATYVQRETKKRQMLAAAGLTGIPQAAE